MISRALGSLLILFSLILSQQLPLRSPAEQPPAGADRASDLSLAPAVEVTLPGAASIPSRAVESAASLEPLAPRLPAGAGGPQAALPPPSAASMSGVPSPQAAASPGSFSTFRLSLLGPQGTLGRTSSVSSSTATANQNLVFSTGNWYASLSLDGGKTFQFIDPAAAFPPAYGGFCCNQRTVYDPSNDLFLWLLSYKPDGSQGGIRLASATSADLRRRQWRIWDLPAGAGFQWERAQLEVSASHAWIAANRYTLAGAWDSSSVIRLPLASLVAAGSPEAAIYTSRSNFGLRLARGAGSTMFFASHNTTSQIRIYHWEDASAEVAWDDVDLPPWSDAPRACPTPDGRDWCGRADSRVLAGWVSNGSVGFMWNAAPIEGIPYPYIEAVRVRQSDRTLLPGFEGRPLVYDPNAAIQYPTVSPNARGDLGLSFFLSSATKDPTAAVAIADEFINVPPGWLYFPVLSSTQGPTLKDGSPSNAWGDYISVQPYRPYGLVWTAGSYILVNCGYDLGGCSQPFYMVFGRERDRVSWQDPSLPPMLPLYLPGMLR